MNKTIIFNKYSAMRDGKIDYNSAKLELIVFDYIFLRGLFLFFILMTTILHLMFNVQNLLLSAVFWTLWLTFIINLINIVGSIYINDKTVEIRVEL